MNLFKSRLLRAIEYQREPTEINGTVGKSFVCSLPFSGRVEPWPLTKSLSNRGIYLSCGDSTSTGLFEKSIDMVVTDPPFFDNVHYSELADFFYSWQQLSEGQSDKTTRRNAEVQDTDADTFAAKLKKVFRECHRVLKDDGLLVFTYHHSRNEGWSAVAEAVYGAGFVVINSHPVKSEMSVAMPKSQAKEPIQLDIILVCRKMTKSWRPATASNALDAANLKLQRLEAGDFRLSLNDRKIVAYGQLLTTLDSATEMETSFREIENLVIFNGMPHESHQPTKSAVQI